MLTFNFGNAESGSTGDHSIHRLNQPYALTHECLDARFIRGSPDNPDYDGVSQKGAVIVVSSSDGRWRSSSASGRFSKGDAAQKCEGGVRRAGGQGGDPRWSRAHAALLAQQPTYVGQGPSKDRMMRGHHRKRLKNRKDGLSGIGPFAGI